jgi:uncharacterized NAD(P)/FAD-binding protein YdhS
MRKKIGIIGGGFSGTMTAVQIIKNATSPCDIYIVSEKEELNKGIAYNPYSDKHILNVITGKMSAFPDKPDDFLEYAIQKEENKRIDKALVSNSFLSRKLYGEYLCHKWKEALEEASAKNIAVIEINDTLTKLDKTARGITLNFHHTPNFDVDFCVIATGNQIPKNPAIKNTAFYSSTNYFQNPWKLDSVNNIESDKPVLIVGNGLTMVDTIIGLKEQNYKGEIYSISPNGFNILPHRHSGMKYTAHLDEISEDTSLYSLFQIIHKHIKIVREFGISAEPIIDALRPMSQKIWRNLSIDERKIFMARLRHLFGVARHRIPLHIYDKIQKWRIEGNLHIKSGKIIDIIEENNRIRVEFFDKKMNKNQTIEVSRVINCTGPETNFSKLEDHFLSQCLQSGILAQDELKLGIKTNVDTYQVIDANQKEHNNLFTLGSNLKGELWETTAVNELRQQAYELAKYISQDAFGQISTPEVEKIVK